VLLYWFTPQSKLPPDWCVDLIPKTVATLSVGL
jgi:hypothetical protein